MTTFIQHSGIKHYSLDAKDGDIGRVKDVLFDDLHWVVRYLDVNTSKWLVGRRVLLSPYSVDEIPTGDKKIAVALDKQQIKDAPDIAEHEPVSTRYEYLYHAHFGYPSYWGGYNIWGANGYPIAINPANPQPGLENFEEEREKIAQSHLRSMAELVGYYIEASDGDFGKLADFIFDAETWQIRYVVVDVRRWLPGPSVLISPQWIKNVSWSDKLITVDTSKALIKSAPKYEEPLTRQYEQALFKHFNREPYWQSSAKSATATA